MNLNKPKMPLLIAELSGNHNGDIKNALDSIKAAKDIGASGIKFQTYTPECLTIKSDKSYFKIQGTLWDKSNLYDLYSIAHTPFEWHKDMFDLAKSLDILAFSSPFSKKGVDLLESLNCPMYKIASFEVCDTELLEYVCSTKKPIILSTGIATDTEIQNALDIAKKHDIKDITLLKCTSSYPSTFTDANLLSMPNLSKTWQSYNVKYGLSDHTLGIISPIVATLLGASMIEKHFILDKSKGGVDSAFSLDKDEFKLMIQSIKNALDSLGEANPQINSEKRAAQRIFARSIFVVKDIKKGEKFSEDNLKIIRPNYGVAPCEYRNILGKVAKKDLYKEEPLKDGDY